MPDRDTKQKSGIASHTSDQINRGSSQQGGGGSGQQRQQSQQNPASKPNPGGGDQETQEDMRNRDQMSDHASRKPQVDVERE